MVWRWFVTRAHPHSTIESCQSMNTIWHWHFLSSLTVSLSLTAKMTATIRNHSFIIATVQSNSLRWNVTKNSFKNQQFNQRCDNFNLTFSCRASLNNLAQFIWLTFLLLSCCHVSQWSQRHFVHLLQHSHCLSSLSFPSHFMTELIVSLTCPALSTKSCFFTKVCNRNAHPCTLWHCWTMAIKSTHIVHYIASLFLKSCNEKQPYLHRTIAFAFATSIKSLFEFLQFHCINKFTWKPWKHQKLISLVHLALPCKLPV